MPVPVSSEDITVAAENRPKPQSHPKGEPASLFSSLKVVPTHEVLVRPLFPIQVQKVSSLEGGAVCQSDAATEQSISPLPRTSGFEGVAERGFWASVPDVAKPAVAGSEMMLMRSGLSATASFFEKPSLALLQNWPLLSQKMDRFCTLPHALEAGLNPDMIANATRHLHRYFIDMYRHSLEKVLKVGFDVSTKSLQSYFLESFSPVLDQLDINNRFHREYLHAPLSLIKSVSGVAEDEKKVVFYAVLNALREGVLMRELAEGLTPDLDLVSRQAWCRSLLQDDQKGVLLQSLYTSFYGDVGKKIEPRDALLTKVGSVFLEKLFHFPKGSMDPFVDFYFNAEESA